MMAVAASPQGNVVFGATPEPPRRVLFPTEPGASKIAHAMIGLRHPASPQKADSSTPSFLVAVSAFLDVHGLMRLFHSGFFVAWLCGLLIIPTGRLQDGIPSAQSAC